MQCWVRSEIESTHLSALGFNEINYNPLGSFGVESCAKNLRSRCTPSPQAIAHLSTLNSRTLLTSASPLSFYDDTFDQLTVSRSPSPRRMAKKKTWRFEAASKTIQQLQLHPQRHRQTARILMDSLAVKGEMRAASMIYARWRGTVSEK